MLKFTKGSFFKRTGSTINRLTSLPPDQQARFIQSYLQGEAKLFYNQLTPQQKLNIFGIKQRLLAQYGLSSNKYLDLFDQRKPKLNEKPRTFGLDLQNLLAKAMPNLHEQERETLLKNKVTKYLPSSLQKMIQFSGPKSWNELVQAAESAIDSFGITEVFPQTNV